MANTVIERDEVQQEEFGKYLEEFSQDMREVCNNMKRNLADAGDNMRENNAQQALQYLEELVDGILSALPGVEEFGAKQKTLARTIGEARNFKFSR